MRHVIFDVETDGLLDDLTRIHSLVLRDRDSDTVLSCADQPGYTPLQEGLQLLSRAERVYGHNIISFDIPAIQKVYPGFLLTGKVFDTYVVAASRWAHIKEEDYKRGWGGTKLTKYIGRHSLAAWGHRLGILKDDYAENHDFTEWSLKLQQHCEQDTAVTKALVFRIRKAGVPAEVIDTEQRLALYLFHQERNGWPFDVEKATALQAKLSAKRQELETELKTLFSPWFITAGLVTPKRDNKKRGIVAGCQYTKIKLLEFNPASRDHIASRLIKLYDWKPRQFTASGKPEVDENTLKGLDYAPVVKLRDYLLLIKRLGQLVEGKQSWMRHVTGDKPWGGKLTGLQHIHGRMWQSGTVTHRAAHSTPNLGQVPKVENPYGSECRELFYPGPPGWVQIGADAASLEARCLGHYMARYDDGAFGQSALAEKPNDIHTLNAGLLGITRDRAKTWFYAFLYGAGDEKLGKIAQPGLSPTKAKARGAEDRKKFLKGVRAMGLLVTDIRAVANRKGYLKLIDGRRTYIRSEHAALNSLLQGTGAVICKRWIVEFTDRLTARFGPQGWAGQWAALGWIHDEVQIAVRKEVVDEVAAILVSTMRDLTQHFGFRIPLDGDAKIGANWKECH